MGEWEEYPKEYSSYNPGAKCIWSGISNAGRQNNLNCSPGWDTSPGAMRIGFRQRIA